MTDRSKPANQVDERQKLPPSAPQRRDDLVSGLDLGDPDPLGVEAPNPPDALTDASRNPRRSDALRPDPDNTGPDAFDGEVVEDGEGRKFLPPAPQHAILKHPTDYVEPEQAEGQFAGMWVNSRSHRINTTPVDGPNNAVLRYGDPRVQGTVPSRRSKVRKATPAPNTLLSGQVPAQEPREERGEVFTYDEIEMVDADAQSTDDAGRSEREDSEHESK